MKLELFTIIFLCIASSLAMEQTLTEAKITSLIENVSNNLQQTITNLLTNLLTGIDLGKRDLLNYQMRSSVIGNILKAILDFIDDIKKVTNLLLPVIGVIIREVIDKLSKSFKI